MRKCSNETIRPITELVQPVGLKRDFRLFPEMYFKGTAAVTSHIICRLSRERIILKLITFDTDAGCPSAMGFISSGWDIGQKFL